MKRLATLALAVSLWPAPAAAQWARVYETGSDTNIRAFATDGSRLLAAIGRYPGGSDVVATEDGVAWTSLGAPFPEYAYVVDALYAKGGTVLAGYSGGGVGGVLRTDDGGATWRAWNAGFGGETYVYDLAVKDGLAFAASSRGVYRARLDDEAWAFMSAQIPGSTYGVVAIAQRGQTVVAGSYGDPFFDPTTGVRAGGATASAAVTVVR